MIPGCTDVAGGGSHRRRNRNENTIIFRSLGRPASRVCYCDASRQKPTRSEPLSLVLTYLPTYNTFTDERTSTTRNARRRRRGVLLLLLLPHHSAGPRERCSLVRIVFAPLNIGSSGVHSLLSNPTARPSAQPRNDIITIINIVRG